MDAREALYGVNPEQRIVAVEASGHSTVTLYHRHNSDRVTTRSVPVRPFLVTTRAGVKATSAATSVENLLGELLLNYRLEFADWGTYRRATNVLREAGIPYYTRPMLAEQFLLSTGTTLFKDMDYDDLLRLQLDIETDGLNPRNSDSHVLMVAVATNRGFEEVLELERGGEAELIERASDLIRELDPDVIEGHNLFRFDLPFLMIRGRRHGVELPWGRDGSAVRLSGQERLRAGARSVPFPNIRVRGRHLVDTYHQVQRYDTAGEFESYGLKESITFLGLERADRAFLAGEEISAAWSNDIDQLRRYALDDVRDVQAIATLTALTDFYQTQMIPRSYQDVATGGTGEKINLLMARAYLAEGHALPVASEPREISGGWTELRHSGVFRAAVKCDVESLYPANMLSEGVAPASDRLEIYLTLLQELTNRRIDAKRQFQQTSGSARHRWNGLQSSFKVLINSFYGYLGYSGGIFNDYAAAERVTRRGQELIRQVVDELEHNDAVPIEIDTDGVYFQPPPGVNDETQEIAFVEKIGEALPPGITLAHDGSYAGMVSLKTKNYALVTRSGQVVLKGSSLRSRRDEPILRTFLTDAVRAFVTGDPGDVRSHYFATARRILNQQFSVDEISRTESITEKTFTSQANRRLAAIAQQIPQGERVRVYERRDGSLALMRDYADDPNIDYLLRRLHDTARRFQPLYQNEREFDYTFPLVRSTSDLSALEASQPVEQLGLFPE
jgi:DNA polymerase, archaea type